MVSVRAKVSIGDLARHKCGINKETAGISERIGLVIAINPVLGSGFQSAEIMWCTNGNIETVMLNYLRPINKL